MAEKKPHEIKAVEFRGQEFDIDKTAFASLKVQTALNLGLSYRGPRNWFATRTRARRTRP